MPGTVRRNYHGVSRMVSTGAQHGIFGVILVFWLFAGTPVAGYAQMPPEDGVLELLVWMDREAPEPEVLMHSWSESGDPGIGGPKGADSAARTPAEESSESIPMTPEPVPPGEAGLVDRLVDPTAIETPDLRIAVLLDFARSLVSGMIYGYSFSYIPSDNARQVSERFTLTPLHRIPWGDPGLEFLEGYDDASMIELRLRYWLQDWQIQRRNAWLTPGIPNSQSRGTASYTMDVSGQLQAVQEAVKQAIRSHARGITYDKPQSLEGQVLLETPPRIIVRAGEFLAEVRVRIQIDSIREYRVF